MTAIDQVNAFGFQPTPNAIGNEGVFVIDDDDLMLGAVLGNALNHVIAAITYDGLWFHQLPSHGQLNMAGEIWFLLSGFGITSAGYVSLLVLFDGNDQLYLAQYDIDRIAVLPYNLAMAQLFTTADQKVLQGLVQQFLERMT